MSCQGFYRGTSHDQVPFFANKEKKMIENKKWPPEFDKEVDMSKVNMQMISSWITKRITELLGFEDEIVIDYCCQQLVPQPSTEIGSLSSEKICPKKLQINMTGFLAKNASSFVKDLWALLLNAQESESGIPKQFLEERKKELANKQLESDKLREVLEKVHVVANSRASFNSDTHHKETHSPPTGTSHPLGLDKPISQEDKSNRHSFHPSNTRALKTSCRSSSRTSSEARHLPHRATSSTERHGSKSSLSKSRSNVSRPSPHHSMSNDRSRDLVSRQRRGRYGYSKTRQPSGSAQRRKSSSVSRETLSHHHQSSSSSRHRYPFLSGHSRRSSSHETSHSRRRSRSPTSDCPRLHSPLGRRRLPLRKERPTSRSLLSSRKRPGSYSPLQRRRPRSHCLVQRRRPSQRSPLQRRRPTSRFPLERGRRGSRSPLERGQRGSRSPLERRRRGSRSPLERGRRASRSPLERGRRASRSPLERGRRASRSPLERGRRGSRSPLERGRRASRSPLERGRRGSHSPLERGRRGSRSPLERGRRGSRSPLERGRRGSRSPLERGRRGSRSPLERGRRASRSPLERGRRGSHSPLERGRRGSHSPLERGRRGSRSPLERGRRGSRSPLERGRRGSRSPLERGRRGSRSPLERGRRGSHSPLERGRRGSHSRSQTTPRSRSYLRKTRGSSVSSSFQEDHSRSPCSARRTSRGDVRKAQGGSFGIREKVTRGSPSRRRRRSISRERPISVSASPRRHVGSLDSVRNHTSHSRLERKSSSRSSFHPRRRKRLNSRSSFREDYRKKGCHSPTRRSISGGGGPSGWCPPGKQSHVDPSTRHRSPSCAPRGAESGAVPRHSTSASSVEQKQRPASGVYQTSGASRADAPVAMLPQGGHSGLGSRKPSGTPHHVAGVCRGSVEKKEKSCEDGSVSSPVTRKNLPSEEQERRHGSRGGDRRPSSRSCSKHSSPCSSVQSRGSHVERKRGTIEKGRELSLERYSRSRSTMCGEDKTSMHPPRRREKSALRSRSRTSPCRSMSVPQSERFSDTRALSEEARQGKRSGLAQETSGPPYGKGEGDPPRWRDRSSCVTVSSSSRHGAKYSKRAKVASRDDVSPRRRYSTSRSASRSRTHPVQQSTSASVETKRSLTRHVEGKKSTTRRISSPHRASRYSPTTPVYWFQRYHSRRSGNSPRKFHSPCRQRSWRHNPSVGRRDTFMHRSAKHVSSRPTKVSPKRRYTSKDRPSWRDAPKHYNSIGSPGRTSSMKQRPSASLSCETKRSLSHIEDYPVSTSHKSSADTARHAKSSRRREKHAAEPSPKASCERRSAETRKSRRPNSSPRQSFPSRPDQRKRSIHVRSNQPPRMKPMRLQEDDHRRPPSRFLTHTWRQDHVSPMGSRQSTRADHSHSVHRESPMRPRLAKWRPSTRHLRSSSQNSVKTQDKKKLKSSWTAQDEVHGHHLRAYPPESKLHPHTTRRRDLSSQGVHGSGASHQDCPRNSLTHLTDGQNNAASSTASVHAPGTQDGDADNPLSPAEGDTATPHYEIKDRYAGRCYMDQVGVHSSNSKWPGIKPLDLTLRHARR